MAGGADPYLCHVLTHHLDFSTIIEEILVFVIQYILSLQRHYLNSLPTIVAVGMAISLFGFIITEDGMCGAGFAREMLAEIMGTFFLLFIGCGG